MKRNEKRRKEQNVNSQCWENWITRWRKIKLGSQEYIIQRWTPSDLKTKMNDKNMKLNAYNIREVRQ